MNSDQLQQLRHTLEDELATLEQFINEELPVEETEISAIDNHPADAATDLTTVITELTLNELKEEEIERIKTALTAMDEGTYGKCAVCGENIPFERLEAIPTALTCVDHAEKENVE